MVSPGTHSLLASPPLPGERGQRGDLGGLGRGPCWASGSPSRSACSLAASDAATHQSVWGQRPQRATFSGSLSYISLGLKPVWPLAHKPLMVPTVHQRNAQLPSRAGKPRPHADPRQMQTALRDSLPKAQWGQRPTRAEHCLRARHPLCSRNPSAPRSGPQGVLVGSRKPQSRA